MSGNLHTLPLPQGREGGRGQLLTLTYGNCSVLTRLLDSGRPVRLLLDGVLVPAPFPSLSPTAPTLLASYGIKSQRSSFSLQSLNGRRPKQQGTVQLGLGPFPVLALVWVLGLEGGQGTETKEIPGWWPA